MKKIIYLIIFIIAMPIYSQQTHTFWGLPWESTQAQIIRELGAFDDIRRVQEENREFLIYKGTDIAGHKSDLGIRLTGRKMDIATYIFEKEISMPSESDYNDKLVAQLLDAYNDCLIYLTEKYGNPTEKQTLNYTKGKSISIPEYVQILKGAPYFAIWNLPNFNIMLWTQHFTGEKIRIMIYHMSDIAWKEGYTEIKASIDKMRKERKE